MFYQPQFNQFHPTNTLIRVNGMDGASAYQMNPNSVVALFDNNKDVFYVKQTDGAGFPTIRTFEFTEVSNTNNTESFITREEMEKYVEQFISESNATVQQRTDRNGQGNSSKQRD